MRYALGRTRCKGWPKRLRRIRITARPRRPFLWVMAGKPMQLSRHRKRRKRWTSTLDKPSSGGGSCRLRKRRRQTLQPSLSMTRARRYTSCSSASAKSRRRQGATGHRPISFARSTTSLSRGRRPRGSNRPTLSLPIRARMQRRCRHPSRLSRRQRRSRINRRQPRPRAAPPTRRLKRRRRSVSKT